MIIFAAISGIKLGFLIYCLMTKIEVGWVTGLMWGSFVLSVTLAVDLQLTRCLLRVPKTQQPQATSSPQMTDVAQLVNNEHMIDEKP